MKATQAVIVAVLTAVAAFAEPSTTQPADRDAAASQPVVCWVRVTGDKVNVRTQADVNSLVVARLAKDECLRSIGEQNGWRRVLPPKDAFCYVHADYVDQRGDDWGVVSLHDGVLRVRAGSLTHKVDPLKTEVLARLSLGKRVRIMGRDGDWLRIAPPAGLCFFISSDYAKPVSEEEAQQLLAARKAATSQPADDGQPDLSGQWGRKLSELEKEIVAEAKQPALAQRWDAFLERLAPIARQREEENVARLAAEWEKRLRERQAEQAALREALRIVNKDAQHGQTQSDDADAGRFAAKGQLLECAATHREGAGKLYKLQNPIDQKLVVFIEFADESQLDLEALLGEYVGVCGDRRHDAALGADVIRVKTAEIAAAPDAGDSSREAG